MRRKVVYWVMTGLLPLSAVFAGVNYLWGGQQAVQAFVQLEYPQQLRVLLGIAKFLGQRDDTFRNRPLLQGREITVRSIAARKRNPTF